jgi:cytochrome c oxidase accessory protein FixG
MDDCNLKSELRRRPEQTKKPERHRDFNSNREQSGKRKWMFPRKPRGKYTNYRNFVAYTILLFYFVLPFITINGNPFLLLNVLNQQFFIIGQPFYMQDFFILTVGVIVFLISIIIFTIAFGRVFCGWICPQTIFLENVFRKIEYTIEGDRNEQIRLANQDWNFEKVSKRALKWIVFIILSLLFTHWLLMYFVGYQEVFRIVCNGPSSHQTIFTAMIVSTAAFYFVFAYFREHVCTLVCPYGMLQSVLIDEETINVSYDFKRGESRSKWNKNEGREAAGKGDCIDCYQCVVVCPTGIDIRDGLQLECVHCTACIDACDEVMDKAGLPRGLIRYASETEIETPQRTRFSKKTKTFAVILVALQIFLGFLLYNRADVEGKFVKSSGSTFSIRNGKITNTYSYSLINKTNQQRIISIRILKPGNGEVSSSSSSKIIVDRHTIKKGTINISFPEKDIRLSKQSISIGVFDVKGNLIESYETYFEGPFKLS